MESSIDRGRRSSTARAYLRPARTRPNLTIRTGALTTRLVIEHGRCVGSEYVRNGQVEQVRALREVLLCGGTYGSPQMLMLSGIGPAAHLESVGIKPLLNVPGVGQNLSEHSNYTSFYSLKERIGLTRLLRMDRATLLAGRWFARHDGIFASNGASANIFFRSTDGLDRPDVQLTPMAVNNSAGMWLPGLTAPPLFCYSIRIGVLHPRSRGWVKLRSADPRDKPRILFNMYAEPEDMATMIRGVRACRDIFSRSPLADMVEREQSPGNDRVTDEDLADIIRRDGNHRSHPVGTCRMGVDKDAVVDAQLRFRGIEGLRVVDASVMPDVPSGNTNIPTIMIGERAADLIRGRSLPPAAV